jgi:hypothetical protein
MASAARLFYPASFPLETNRAVFSFAHSDAKKRGCRRQQKCNEYYVLLPGNPAKPCKHLTRGPTITTIREVSPSAVAKTMMMTKASMLSGWTSLRALSNAVRDCWQTMFAIACPEKKDVI